MRRQIRRLILVFSAMALVVPSGSLAATKKPKPLPAQPTPVTAGLLDTSGFCQTKLLFAARGPVSGNTRKSPNGTSLSTGVDYGELMSLDLGTGAIKPSGVFGDWLQTYGPDGSVYVTDRPKVGRFSRKVTRVQPDGTASVVLQARPGEKLVNVSVSPSGRFIVYDSVPEAYEKGAADIPVEILDTQSGAIRQIPSASVTYFDFLATDTQVVFFANYKGSVWSLDSLTPTGVVVEGLPPQRPAGKTEVRRRDGLMSFSDLNLNAASSLSNETITYVRDGKIVGRRVSSFYSELHPTADLVATGSGQIVTLGGKVVRKFRMLGGSGGSPINEWIGSSRLLLLNGGRRHYVVDSSNASSFYLDDKYNPTFPYVLGDKAIVMFDWAESGNETTTLHLYTATQHVTYQLGVTFSTGVPPNQTCDTLTPPPMNQLR